MKLNEIVEKLEAKLTQKLLAKFIGVSTKSIYYWKTGKRGISKKNEAKLLEAWELFKHLKFLKHIKHKREAIQYRKALIEEYFERKAQKELEEKFRDCKALQFLMNTKDIAIKDIFENWQEYEDCQHLTEALENFVREQIEDFLETMAVNMYLQNVQVGDFMKRREAFLDRILMKLKEINMGLSFDVWLNSDGYYSLDIYS